MPSPSADSKFVLSIPKIFKHTQFFNHTQNIFGILKRGILLHKLDYLSVLKNLSSILKENLGSADGLGISLYIHIPNIFLGFEFEFGPQRIRDLAFMCP